MQELKSNGESMYWIIITVQCSCLAYAICLLSILPSGKLKIMDMQMAWFLVLETLSQKVQLTWLSFRESVSNFLQMFGTV